MIPLTGYANRLSVRPGETIDFKISSTASEPYQASLVRIRSADPNPDGPGMKETPLDSAFAGSYPSREQALLSGSYARIDDASALEELESITLTATIWPTKPGGSDQAVLAHFDPETGSGIALCIGADGAAEAVYTRPDHQPRQVHLGQASTS